MIDFNNFIIFKVFEVYGIIGRYFWEIWYIVLSFI